MKKLKLQFHSELNPNLWDGDTLNAEVKQALMKIAVEFVKFLKVDVAPSDVVLVGSAANYNYTQFSDIDLHIIMDFTKIGDDREFVKEYVDAKKFIWNDEHDIKIHGQEVECYVQGLDETNASAAVYSLMTGDWIKKPDPTHPKIDMETVLTKVKDISSRIEQAKGDEQALDKIKAKLKVMRQSGLDRAGEYSTENLVFKALRNAGKIDILSNYAKNIFDKTLSLKELNEWNELTK